MINVFLNTDIAPKGGVLVGKNKHPLGGTFQGCQYMSCEPGQFSARISESLQSWYRAKRRSSVDQAGNIALIFFFIFFLLLEAATQYRITMLASLPDNAAGL